jgi:hypothetical protein
VTSFVFSFLSRTIQMAVQIWSLAAPLRGGLAQLSGNTAMCRILVHFTSQLAVIGPSVEMKEKNGSLLPQYWSDNVAKHF